MESFNMSIKPWVQAARLRTLPLSISGILVGSGIALSQDLFNTKIFILALCTTIGFQILSNFANDYGDGVKGTDNDDRVGPKRAIQSGAITPKGMKMAMAITTVITLLIAIWLIYEAFGAEKLLYSLLFFGLGIASIIAAITYTVGKNAYGYHGLGDVFVFLFFGWLSVAGSYFLYAQTLHWMVFLPASSIGLLSAAVLNLNNMRDYESDTKAGKKTLVVKIGLPFAKYYHYYLIVMAMLLMMLYSILKLNTGVQLLYLLAFIPLSLHLLKVRRAKDSKLLDPELKKVALSTVLMALLILIGYLL